MAIVPRRVVAPTAVRSTTVIVPSVALCAYTRPMLASYAISSRPAPVFWLPSGEPFVVASTSTWPSSHETMTYDFAGSTRTSRVVPQLFPHCACIDRDVMPSANVRLPIVALVYARPASASIASPSGPPGTDTFAAWTGGAFVGSAPTVKTSICCFAGSVTHTSFVDGTYRTRSGVAAQATLCTTASAFGSTTDSLPLVRSTT